MPKVLIVSYFFPPLSGMGALRIGKYYQYLPEFGYQPIVLAGGDSTVSNSSVFRPFIDLVLMVKKWANQRDRDRSYHHPKDRVKIPLSQKIQSVGLLSGTRMPDIYLSWALLALPLGLKMIKKYQPDIIFSSHSPPASHIVASLLQAKAKVPWVAEFRDPWANNPFNPRMPLWDGIDSFLESRVLRRAMNLVTVTPPLAARLSQSHGKPTEVIYNGFDEADYPKKININNYFTMTYTGLIVAGKRDPVPVYQALKLLASQDHINPEKFRLRFYGPDIEGLLAPLAEQYGVRKFCEFHKPVSYQESLYRQCQSDILLLLEWNNDKLITVPGKVFEYLGANRPILCTGYRYGPLAEILKTAKVGVVLNEPEEIAEYILKKYKIWEKETRDKHTSLELPDSIKQFSRRNSAQKLATIFNELLNC